MTRLFVYLVIFATLSLFLFDLAHGQIMRQFPIICDLYVNGYRVSWPPGGLSARECDSLREAISAKDETEAKIECNCKPGGRA